MSDAIQILVGTLVGAGSSTVFILALFIGFCVLVGFTKTKRTAGGGARVIKSLDETLSHQAMIYLTPTAPRGPADQLRSPELIEAAARKS
jgi:acid phosphatase family membrane protein YuiD